MSPRVKGIKVERIADALSNTVSLKLLTFTPFVCVCVSFVDEIEWMVELCGAAVVKDPLLPDAKQVGVQKKQLTACKYSPYRKLGVIYFFMLHRTLISWSSFSPERSRRPRTAVSLLLKWKFSSVCSVWEVLLSTSLPLLHTRKQQRLDEQLPTVGLELKIVGLKIWYVSTSSWYRSWQDLQDAVIWSILYLEATKGAIFT